jgi:hypothetical protein
MAPKKSTKQVAKKAATKLKIERKKLITAKSEDWYELAFKRFSISTRPPERTELNPFEKIRLQSRSNGRI